MELRRLCDSFHARDLRQQLAQQARFIEQLKGAPRGALREHFRQLVAQSLLRHLTDFSRAFDDGRARGSLDYVAKTRRETDSANQAQFVFVESELGVANRANNAGY